MPTYYVNSNSKGRGNHDVHKMGCGFLPKKEENRIKFGVFSCCDEAVEEARKLYPRADGCYYCSRDCYEELVVEQTG